MSYNVAVVGATGNVGQELEVMILDVDHERDVGNIDQHVQRLPDRCAEIRQPEVMTRGRHEKQNRERTGAQRLERKLSDAVKASVPDKEAQQGVHVAESMKLN